MLLPALDEMPTCTAVEGNEGNGAVKVVELSDVHFD